MSDNTVMVCPYCGKEFDEHDGRFGYVTIPEEKNELRVRQHIRRSKGNGHGDINEFPVEGVAR